MNEWINVSEKLGWMNECTDRLGNSGWPNQIKKLENQEIKNSHTLPIPPPLHHPPYQKIRYINKCFLIYTITRKICMKLARCKQSHWVSLYVENGKFRHITAIGAKNLKDWHKLQKENIKKGASLPLPYVHDVLPSFM